MTTPRLILLNGPPATGKSTLARRYVEDNPLSLTLDIDRIRDLIGGWPSQPYAAGLLARSVAVAGARAHLGAGHDVVVPQLLTDPGFVGELEEVAASVQVAFHEVTLLDSKENALRRLIERTHTSPDPTHRIPNLTLPPVPPSPAAADSPGRGDEAYINGLYDRLTALLATRPGVKVIHSHEGDIDRTYRDFLACLS
ncbi:AAA family ATPase [Actinoplanes sp. GCM10030250]|uniref:AAA family ATPase n=1 Tax=Actinoplanes sp. GCM10030250 TaxID=3273376 RepID=UPI00361FB47F